MDHLLECAEAFEQLLDVQYHIVLGRKNRLTELTLRFDPTEFHHLVGLHKLRDLRLARGNREKIYFQKRFAWKISKRAVIFRKYKIVCSSLIK